ncbi:MAG: hypothetical protein OEQ47_04640 [Acidimicrobiia bacterium]|nr:hypothetical protein [Acidimicrobiia bacterium]
MEAPEDLYPITLPAGVVELRIHGVSGTPPEDLLRDFPIRVAGDARSGFYRAETGEPEEEGVIEAYSWGGLTSASRLTAAWLLVLPFALLNVAGWMAPLGAGAERYRSKIRLLGVVLSAFVGVASFNVFRVVLTPDTTSWMPDWLETAVNKWAAEINTRLFLAALLSGVLVASLFALTRIRSSDEDLAVTAPSVEYVAAASTLSDGLLHVAGGLSMIALVVGHSSDSWYAVALSLLTLAVVLWAILVAMANPVVAAALAGLAGTLWVWASVVTLRSESISTAVESIELAFAGVVLSAVGLVVAALIVSWSSGGTGIGPAFATFAFAAAASAASGIVLAVDRKQSLVSIDLTTFVFAVTALAVATAFFADWKPAVVPSTALERAIRLRSAVWGLVGTLRVAGLGLIAVFFVFGGLYVFSELPDPRDSSWAAVAWLLPILVAFAAGRRVGMALVIGGAALWLFLDRWVIEPFCNVGGCESPEGDLASTLANAFLFVASYATAVVPVLAVGWFLVRASSARSNRRAVGVFWDLVNYWPRSYHPWAPVPYVMRAVTDLANRIAFLTGQGNAVVISAHSQGAVIAMPLIEELSASLDPESLALVRLMTYGNLLDRHYAALFPRSFNSDTFGVVSAAVGGHWQNLWRDTDPLGANIVALNDDSTMVTSDGPNGTLLTHSDYQYSQAQYLAALAALGVPATPAD